MILGLKPRSDRRVSPWARSSSILPAVAPLPDRADEAYKPSRHRVRRRTDQWMPIGEAGFMARITVLQHGGHQRPVIHRGSKHSRFRFTSIKTGTTQLGEGRGEEALAYYNEVATWVIDYECHPYLIEVMTPSGRLSYRPDTVRVLANGRIQLIEVKRTPRDIEDPDLRERLAWATEICRRCGWDFEILYLDDVIGPPARRMNVSALYTRRTMELSQREERVAGRLVAIGDRISWGDLRDRLSPLDHLHGDAVIERLLARGMLSADLDVRFTRTTILQPTRPFTGVSDIRL